MKKILSAVAALGLVAGVATTASALEFNVSGHYFVEGVYLSSGDGTGLVLNDDDRGNDAFWRHEFKIKPTMKVNDKIVVKSTIYLANSGASTAGSDGTWGSTDDTVTQDGGNIDVQHIYMEYMSPVGKVRVGRTSAGLWQGDFLSNDSNGNRIMYFPNFMPENWGSCVYLQKKAEGDLSSDTDADSDYYDASVWYKTKDMVVALAYGYDRNATNDGTAASTTFGWVDADDDPSTVDTWAATTTAATSASTTTSHIIKGYYNQNFSNMYAEVEFKYTDGDTEKDFGDDTDKSTFGLMADVGMNMDKLDVGMMFIYGSGDDDDADNDTENLGQLGEQFQPYNILTGASTGMMVTDYTSANAAMTTAGIVSLGVHADFAVSDVLSLNSALVYAQAENELTGWDDEYGWEIDLGMSYALMDNLTYQVDFGYLVAGDFFEYGDSTTDAEDVYSLTHRLTMEF